mmetsp:Transcript_21602/g.61549  ORF Transcript_21602/g.61549 Transcript_21602/m.61549 type:complete len:278 (-) Transcript_21602:408-1241(-)
MLACERRSCAERGTRGTQAADEPRGGGRTSAPVEERGQAGGRRPLGLGHRPETLLHYLAGPGLVRYALLRQHLLGQRAPPIRAAHGVVERHGHAAQPNRQELRHRQVGRRLVPRVTSVQVIHKLLHVLATQQVLPKRVKPKPNQVPDYILVKVLAPVPRHAHHVQQHRLVVAIDRRVQQAGRQTLPARQHLGRPKVDQPDPVVAQEHKVARVRVGIERAHAHQLVPVHAHQRVHNARRVRGQRRVPVAHPLARERAQHRVDRPHPAVHHRVADADRA